MYCFAKLFAIATVALAGFAGLIATRIVFSEVALMELYPDVDPNIVIKAHRNMLKDVLRHEVTLPETDDEIEKLFRNSYLLPLI